MVCVFVSPCVCVCVCVYILEVAPHDRQRKVYWCRVMGGRGCGKSGFVRGLVGKAKVSQFFPLHSLLKWKFSSHRFLSAKKFDE